MEGYLTLHKDGCFVRFGDSIVRVENYSSGCIVSPSRELCNVWSPTRDNLLGFQVLQFEPVPSKSVAEAFAIQRNEWTLQLYRWNDIASYVLELWLNDFCVASLEWWNNEDGVTAYVEGVAKEFIRFAETIVRQKGENER
jgi:hypothetical protein